MNNKTSSISMVVLHIADNLVLKLKVSLYRRGKDQMKMFYSEVEYYHQIHKENVFNINLDYSYGLLLESPYSEPKGSVWIDWFGIYELTITLRKVIRWFQAPKDPMYENVNGHVQLTKEGNELYEDCLISGIKLIFNPTVIVNPLTNIASAGVVLTYTTNPIKVTINIQNVIAWYSYISRVDLAAAAQSLLSYVRPPQPGTNRIVLNNYSTTPAQTDQTSYGMHGINGRRFDGNKEDDELK